MSYWAMERQERTLDGYLPREDLLDEAMRNGICPVTARQVLLGAFGNKPVPMHFVDSDGPVIDATRVTDLVFWSWVPVFSDRARHLLVGQGAASADFVEATVEAGVDPRHLHLPPKSYDVVDLERSAFVMTLPLDPPLPHGIRALSTKRASGPLPPCLRATVPGHAQVFGELLVSDNLRREWEQAGLTGAVFRDLTPR
jgi:hypothetical protein